MLHIREMIFIIASNNKYLNNCNYVHLCTKNVCISYIYGTKDRCKTLMQKSRKEILIVFSLQNKPKVF